MTKDVLNVDKLVTNIAIILILEGCIPQADNNVKVTNVSYVNVSSAGTDLCNFVTRVTTTEMDYIAKQLHQILKSNRELINLESVDLSQKVNHCSFILYYTGDVLKKLLQ